MHHMQKWRTKFPLRAAYRALVDHARNRKIYIDLTWEQFSKWTQEVGLFVGQVRTPDLHIDRKDATKGYTLTNLSVLSSTENVSKGNRERHYPEYKSNRWSKTPAPPENPDEDPF